MYDEELTFKAEAALRLHQVVTQTHIGRMAPPAITVVGARGL